MRNQELDPKDTRWDRFRAFHQYRVWVGVNIVQFATNEWAVYGVDVPPAARRSYDRFGLTIAMASDDHCPALRLGPEKDSKHVPAAWCASRNGAINSTMVIDHLTGIVVPLTGYLSIVYDYAQQRVKIDRGIPHYIATRVNSGLVYFGGPTAEPRSAVRFRLSRPSEPTAAERAQAKDYHAQCTMWRAMVHPDLHDDAVKARIAASWSGSIPYRATLEAGATKVGMACTLGSMHCVPYDRCALARYESFDAIHESARLQVALFGITDDRVKFDVDRLYTDMHP